MKETKKPDRDEHGRLLPGHSKPGPGRPKRTAEREYLDAVIGSCSLARWSRIATKACQQAEAGDRYARDWLTRILLPNLELVAQLARDETKAGAPARDYSRLTVEEALMLRSLMLKAAAPDPAAATVPG